MAFQVSPGVVVKEEDLSSIIPAVSSTIGGVVAKFQTGPCNQIVTVDSENELVALFGKPDESNYEGWFTAANFLGYGSNLKVVRSISQTAGHALNAAGPSAGTFDSPFFQNSDAASATALNAVAGGIQWIARFPGQLGNSLKVVWHDGGASAGGTVDNTAHNAVSAGFYNNWDQRYQFNNLMPKTTGWAETLSGSSTVFDAFNLAVIDEDGLFSGVKGTVLETFDGVSKASNARNADNTSNYYRDVINEGSKFIYAGSHPASGVTGGLGVNCGSLEWGVELTTSGGTFDVLSASATAGFVTSLSGGSGSTSGTISATKGSTVDYGLFYDAETVDVSLLMGSNASASLAGNLVDLVDHRKDAMVFLSPESSDILANGVPRSENDILTAIEDFRNTQLNKSSSYAVLDSGYKLMYDRYNDKTRYVPLNGDVAGLACRSDEVSETWFSPAGFNRGQLRGVIRLAYNPRKTDRDNLYQAGVNPVVSFPGEGTVLFGDKTLLSKPSAFDRINVRRLFIVLEKAISTAAKFQLFEQNDEFTRSNFKSIVEPFLRDVQSRRGIQSFKVICDETNNTAAVRDRNEFVADIFIKPTKSINFITLTFVATSQGVDFSEIGS